MSKRNLLNLLLLLLLAGLVLLVWLEPGRKTDPPVEKISTLSPETIEHIRIERPAGVVVMQRDGDDWELREPVRLPANTVRIRAITSIAASESLGRHELIPQELARFGLDPPQARLWLDDVNMDFGHAAPLDNRRYVRVGDTLHIIQDLRYYQLVGDWTGYVSLRLLEEGQKLAGIELPGLQLLNREGSWVPEPRPDTWSADAATLLAQRWEGMQAMQIREYHGNAEGAEIRLHLRDGEQALHFVILQRDPELILLRPDVQLAYTLVHSADEVLRLPDPEAE